MSTKSLERELLELCLKSKSPEKVKFIVATEKGIKLGTIDTPWNASEVSSWILMGLLFTVSVKINEPTKELGDKK
jgi:hypothetical protein